MKISDLIDLLKKSQRDIPLKVIEKLEQHADKTTQELIGLQPGDIQQQQELLGPCECDRLVPFCCDFIVPKHLDNIDLDSFFLVLVPIDTSCLQCSIDECTITIDNVSNPCGPGTLPAVDVTVDAAHFTGCLSFDFCLTAFEPFDPVFYNNGSSFCCSGTSCVDNVVAVGPTGTLNCNDFDPRLIFPIFSLSTPIRTECGNRVVSASGDFILPTSVTNACDIIQLFSENICEGGSALIVGAVVDCNGLPIGNATVNFTVDDPDLGNVNLNSITTDFTGTFFVFFESTNGPGTVTVTATVEGTNVTEDFVITINDCTP